jgi:hypothetical protein
VNRKKAPTSGQSTALRYQHGGRMTQHSVLALFMTNLCPNLENEVYCANSITANIKEYIPLGNTLRRLKTFKGKNG